MNRLQLIQSALMSQDEEVRLSGLQSLYRCADEKRIDLVCASLGDESWRVRKEAVNLFLSLPDAVFNAERIIVLLYDGENAGLRNSAAEILVKLNVPVLPILIKAADSPDPDVRKFILDILGDIGDHGATPLMLRFLQSDPEVNVRASAAENLGKIRDISAVPVMVRALSEPDLLVQFSLLDALGRIGCSVDVEKFINLSEKSLLRKPLFDALGRIGDETAIPVLLAGLLDPMRNVREAAIMALQNLISRYGEAILAGKINATALEGAVTLLASSSLPVQRAALSLLGMHCDRDRAVLLSSYLDDDHLADDVATILMARGGDVIGDLTVCWPGASDKKKAYFAYLFGATGVVNAVNLLVDELKAADDFLRVIILRALGQIGGEKEIVTLAGYLEVQEDDVRQAAVDGLVKVSERFHSPVIDLVREGFSHADPFVRQANLQVLGRLGGDESESVLLMAMKDESALVRRSAIYYLDGRNFCHYPALILALTDEESDVRRQAIEALSMSDDRTLIESFTLVLKDDDPWVRSTAIRAIGRFGGPEAGVAISNGLRDPVGLVTIAALESLTEAGIPFDLEEIAAQLGNDDDDVVLAVLTLLAKSSDHSWLTLWGEALLDHRHWQIRQRVAELLAQVGTKKNQALLQQRLQVEQEDMVRERLRQCLASFADSQENN